MNRSPASMHFDYPAQLAYHTHTLANGCWEFRGRRGANGYGMLACGYAHRLAWELANDAPVPAGLVIDHTCHNLDLACSGGDACPHRRCVNPAHLEAVPQRVNALRGRSLSAAHAQKTHCLHGHEFTDENTYIRPDRFARMCRTCRRARAEKNVA